MSFAYAEGLDLHFDRMEDEFTREEPEEMDPVLESMMQYPQFWDFFPEPEDPIALEAVDLEAWEIQYKGLK